MPSGSGPNTLKVDAEYREVLSTVLQKRRLRPRSDRHDTAARARDIYACFADANAPVLATYDIIQSKHEFKSYDAESLCIYRFQHAEHTIGTKATRLPAVLHIHGGGMFMGSVEENIPAINAVVGHSRVQFFSVEYRLAPQHPHPTPVEDCYAALVWLLESAESMGVDPCRIAIQGESAGGGIAAAVAIMARDRKLEPRLSKQILIYPMLDDRSMSGDPDLDAAALLNFSDNAVGWTALLGEKAGSDDVSPYAAPARVSSVKDLPPTYVDVGGLDIFVSEIAHFASRLAAANNELEFHLYPGVPHAFEALVPTSSVSQQASANRIRALQGL